MNRVPGGDNLVKGVQCYELFGRIAPRNQTFYINEMQFGFMHEKGTIAAVFILSRLQGEYRGKGKKVVYLFCGPGRSFQLSTEEHIQGTCIKQWLMRWKGISEIVARSVISVYR